MKVNWLLLVTAIVIGGVAWLLKTQNDDLVSHGITTTGKVVRFVQSRHMRGSSTLYPVLGFDTESGQHVEAQSKTGSNPSPFKEGQDVKVLYDTREPSKCMVDSWFDLYGMPAILGAISAFCLALSFWQRVARPMRVSAAFLLCPLSALWLAPAQSAELFFDSKNPQAKKVLFIGNSLTYVNQLPLILAALVFDSNTSTELRVGEVVKGGATLDEMYHTTDAEQTIKVDGPWTDVVLQEQSETMVLQPESTRQYVQTFSRVIKASGAKPVIYETWCHKDKTQEQPAIKQLFRELSSETGALFVPAGEAFDLCRRLHPEIELYGDDRHPSHEGTYLAACVFYSKLFGRSPVGLPCDLSVVDQKTHERLKLMTIESKTAAVLQQVAFQAVQSN